MKYLKIRKTKLLIVFSAITLLVSTASSGVALALNGKYDQQFYSDSEILVYNPEDTACGEPSAKSVTALRGKTNREKIYNFWISQGLTPAQSAGITASLAEESGYSAFRQEDGKTWPEGGWGVAKFTGDQRTAAVDFVKKAVGDTTFDSYYKAEYGTPVTESKGFIPANISGDGVNDSFLQAQLDRLVQYTSSFAPATIAERTQSLSTDYNLTLSSGTKLLTYIKTLTSASDAAKAWTYLYEYPAEDIKATADSRATKAESLLIKLTDAASATDEQCNVIGIGGLNFEQAKTFMKTYYSDRRSYFSSYWLLPKNSIQCTAFIVYFNNRFSVTGSGQGNGFAVAKNLSVNFPSAYKIVDKNNIQPFTVFSYGSGNNVNGSPGHTGIILGIEDDGSLIVGETNVTVGRPSGLLDVETTGTKLDNVKGLVAAEKWASIDAWINAFKNMRYGGPTLAAPVDGAGVSSKVEASLNSDGGAPLK